MTLLSVRALSGSLHTTSCLHHFCRLAIRACSTCRRLQPLAKHVSIVVNSNTKDAVDGILKKLGSEWSEQHACVMMQAFQTVRRPLPLQCNIMIWLKLFIWILLTFHLVAFQRTSALLRVRNGLSHWLQWPVHSFFGSVGVMMLWSVVSLWWPSISDKKKASSIASAMQLMRVVDRLLILLLFL